MSGHSKLKSIFTPALVLFVCCLTVAFAVSLTNELTKDRVEEQNQEALASAMGEVIPADTYEAVYADGLDQPQDATIYKALNAQGNLIGMIFITRKNGYGGEISVMTGIAEGEIAAVQVLDCSSETPGLGQNAAEAGFTGQFDGIFGSPSLTKSEPVRDGDVVAITGATITSKAVVEAVQEAAGLYEELTE